eukprot:NODE_7621_length_1563_cov_9.715877.p1 GENE.NODE_7621_length_1563_cov_9.715877~~NODE_7621_length_1563_cov_9.715877.p1  ORF type:complete len:502 (+),score=180.92 NODE_7621_length_1563_cov_9.715877:85-1506(+)
MAAVPTEVLPVPEWLCAAYPVHRWTTLRRCPLRIAAADSAGNGAGAGLDFEASDFGYVVEGVGPQPGQCAELRAGTVVLAIAGVRLHGLSEDALEEAFGANFADGAELLLADAEELRYAQVEHDSQAECPCEEDATVAAVAGPELEPASPPVEQPAVAVAGEDIVTEHGAAVLVPLGGDEALPSVAREQLAKDLAMFSERTGVRAELEPGGVLLTGVPDDVRAARGELGSLLQYYGLGGGASAPQEEAAPPETLEVDGLVMQSLPARHRRKRRGGADVEAAAVAGGGMEAEVADGAAPPVFEELVGVDEVRQYEYMDHTADVILHSWGCDLREAFAQVCVCFFSYLTELDTVDVRTCVEVEATGHDITDLLYHLLDEFLFSFSTEFVVCRRVVVTELDPTGFRVKAKGFGEKFDLKKHPQGTEIKAITMHQLKVLTEDTLTTEQGEIPRKSSDMEGGTVREGFPFECYVLVDI